MSAFVPCTEIVFFYSPPETIQFSTTRLVSCCAKIYNKVSREFLCSKSLENIAEIHVHKLSKQKQANTESFLSDGPRKPFNRIFMINNFFVIGKIFKKQPCLSLSALFVCLLSFFRIVGSIVDREIKLK